MKIEIPVKILRMGKYFYAQSETTGQIITSGSDRDDVAGQLHDMIGKFLERAALTTPQRSGEPPRQLRPSKAFHVFQDGKKLETVYFLASMSPAEVKKSLVDHDGFDADIVVKEGRP